MISGALLKLIPILLLGVIQGLTEFLPVSSSGHLVLGEHLLGVEAPGAALEAALHLGTLAAIIVVYWSDIVHLLRSLPGCLKLILSGKAGCLKAWGIPEHRLLILIFIGLLPAAFAGIVCKSFFERLFDNVLLVGFALFGTGFLLLLTSKAPGEKKDLKSCSLFDAILVGVAQALAITPGFSRSGFTISTGLFRGLEKKSAAKFSFLLSIPAILGAVVLQAPQLFEEKGLEGGSLLPLFSGVLVSFFVGWAALKLLLRVLYRGKLHNFSYYCFLVGAFAILYALL